MKKPTLSSITILIVFMIIYKFDLNYQELDVICYRKAYGEVKSNLITPIFYTLVICSFIEIYNSFKDIKSNFLSAILVFPIIFSFLYWVINIILNLFNN